MKNTYRWGIINGLATGAYIFLVALLMQNVERILGPGPDENFLAPVAFLTLLVLSAAVCGSLVFGRPVLLFMKNQQRAAITMFGVTLATLFVLLVVAFTVLALS